MRNGRSRHRNKFQDRGEPGRYPVETQNYDKMPVFDMEPGAHDSNPVQRNLSQRHREIVPPGSVACSTEQVPDSLQLPLTSAGGSLPSDMSSTNTGACQGQHQVPGRDEQILGRNESGWERQSEMQSLVQKVPVWGRCLVGLSGVWGARSPLGYAKVMLPLL